MKKKLVSYLGREQVQKYQIVCNWSTSLVAADLFSMKSQTTSISSFAPDSKPCESWKIKLLPSYVIWCSISCMPLWQFNPINEWSSIIPLTHLNWWYQMCFTRYQFFTWQVEHKKVYSAFIQLTLLVIYTDRLCSLCYTTNLLKDGCLASIGSAYDKDAKMGTSVLLP